MPYKFHVNKANIICYISISLGDPKILEFILYFMSAVDCMRKKVELLFFFLFIIFFQKVENLYVFFLFLYIYHSLIVTEAIDLKFSDESDDLADEGITGPERTYRGPHINFPLQKKDLDILIDLFRKKKVNKYYFPGQMNFNCNEYFLFIVQQTSCEICSWNFKRCSNTS